MQLAVYTNAIFSRNEDLISNKVMLFRYKMTAASVASLLSLVHSHFAWVDLFLASNVMRLRMALTTRLHSGTIWRSFIKVYAFKTV